MALVFGANTTDVVTVAPAASIDNLGKFSCLIWVNVTTLTASRRFWGKRPGTTANRLLILSGTGGDLQLSIRRTAGALSYITNSTPMASTGTWICLAWTYDDALTSNAAHIYTGSLTAALAEATYGTATNGSGASDQSDAANSLTWGNGLAGSGSVNAAIQGSIAVVMMWNRVLTLAELQQQQYMPRMTSGLVDFHHLGFAGTGTQPDWSGNANAGTVTTATVGAHVPLGAPFGFDTGDAAKIEQTINISTTIAGTSTLTAVLTGAGALAAALDGTSTLAATLTGAGDLAAALDGTSTLTATLVGAGALAAALDGSSTATATLTGAGALSTSAAGTSTCSGTMAGAGECITSISGSATVTATLGGVGALSTMISGTGTCDGTIGGIGACATTIAGSATVTGTLTGAGALSTTISGSSTCTLQVGGDVACTIAGSSTLTATLTGTGALETSIAGTSTASGTLSAMVQISCSMTGTSTCTATPTGGFVRPIATVTASGLRATARALNPNAVVN